MDTLTNVSPDPIHASYQGGAVQPLGQERLKSVELLYQIVRVGKTSVLDILAENNIIKQLFVLIEKHTWNNFLQLRTQQIFEEILEGDASNQLKLKFLESSGAIDALV